MAHAGSTLVDIAFHMESDARGRDPDRSSPTLRSYHQMLWSKRLPGGSIFTLDTDTAHSYLHHESDLGEYFMTSDSIVHSYRNAYRNRIGTLMEQVPAEQAAEIHDEGSTIGGFILFPGDVRDKKPTINGARGMSAKICDRFDLTLECIRRHYGGQPNPLSSALDRYGDFFELFEDFEHYVSFFLLDDLLIPGSDQIRWYLPFDDFERPALPQNAREYQTYREAVLLFVRMRNQRILAWARANLA